MIASVIAGTDSISLLCYFFLHLEEEARESPNPVFGEQARREIGGLIVEKVREAATDRRLFETPFLDTALDVWRRFAEEDALAHSATEAVTQSGFLALVRASYWKSSAWMNGHLRRCNQQFLITFSGLDSSAVLSRATGVLERRNEIPTGDVEALEALIEEVSQNPV